MKSISGFTKTYRVTLFCLAFLLIVHRKTCAKESTQVEVDLYNGIEFSVGPKLKQRKTFLLLGAKGSGKSSFIHGMITFKNGDLIGRTCKGNNDESESRGKKNATSTRKSPPTRSNQTEEIPRQVKRPSDLVEYVTSGFDLKFNEKEISFQLMKCPGFFFDKFDASVIETCLRQELTRPSPVVHGFVLIHRANPSFQNPVPDITECIKVLSKSNIKPHQIGVVVTHTETFSEELRQNYTKKILSELNRTNPLPTRNVIHVGLPYDEDLDEQYRYEFRLKRPQQTLATASFLAQFDDPININALFLDLEHFRSAVHTELHGSLRGVVGILFVLLSIVISLVFVKVGIYKLRKIVPT